MCMTITARFPGCQMILHMDRSIITLQPVLPGAAYPSSNDMQVLSYYSQLGSPQKISEIIPIVKTGTVKFGVNGIKWGEKLSASINIHICGMKKEMSMCL